MRSLPARLALSLSLSATVTVTACMGPHGRGLLGMSPLGTDGRPVGFFSQTQGTSSLTVRIVDERKVQAIADADAYDGVLIQLHNATRLKNDLVAAAAKQGGSYAGVFSKLPSDNGGHYLLTVGLYRNVAQPSSPSDPAYADAQNKTGEGSATFSLDPGENKTVVVTINAVGELTLTSDSLPLDPTSLTSGQTGVTLDTKVNALKDPEADAVKVYVVDGSSVVQSTVTLLKAQWPASPGTVTTLLTVPTLADEVPNAGYTLVVELFKGETLLSRRSQAITVSALVASPTPNPLTPGTTTIAGRLLPPAGTAATQWPFDLADVITAPDGTIYACDSAQHAIYQIANGSVNVIAGQGSAGFSGDGASAASAMLRSPQGLLLDGSGNLYFCDSGNHRIRKIATDGTISTVAGSGTQGVAGDGSAALSAQLNNPGALAWDNLGQLLISDRGNDRVRRIASNGTISTVAGLGPHSFSGWDGNAATNSYVRYPASLFVDGSTVYVWESGANRYRYFPLGGIINTFAGPSNLAQGYNGDDRLAVGALFSNASAMVKDSNGALVFGDVGNHRIRQVLSGIVTTRFGTGVAGFTPDGQSAVGNPLYSPFALHKDASGNYVFTEKGYGLIRRINAATNVLTTLAGNGFTTFAGENVSAQSARFNNPRGVAVDSAGNVYVADSLNHRVRKIATTGIVTTVAGTGTAGYSGDGGLATGAKLNEPGSLCLGSDGALYIADSGNNRIRRVAGGTITTVAGTGTAGYSGDGGQATSSELNYPLAVAERGGSLYISDSNNGRVRKVAPSGTISTSVNTEGYPMGLAVDADGNLYVAEGGLSSVIKVLASDGTVSTIAGNGEWAASGDGGAATDAAFQGPSAVALGAGGVIYVLDYGNAAIRRISATGIITTVVGQLGSVGYLDSSTPTSALFSEPYGLAIGPQGELYVADTANHRIRKAVP